MVWSCSYAASCTWENVLNTAPMCGSGPNNYLTFSSRYTILIRTLEFYESWSYNFSPILPRISSAQLHNEIRLKLIELRFDSDYDKLRVLFFLYSLWCVVPWIHIRFGFITKTSSRKGLKSCELLKSLMIHSWEVDVGWEERCFELKEDEGARGLSLSLDLSWGNIFLNVWRERSLMVIGVVAWGCSIGTKGGFSIRN